MTTVTFHCGDIRDIQATLADDSVDCLITSPPFLALRSYLPADHPDKHREIGSELTPAQFIDTLLALTADWRRLLTPTGSLAVELGDTYSGSGGAGGDYDPGGWREGQERFRQNKYERAVSDGFVDPDGRSQPRGIRNLHGKVQGGGPGWPLAKSLCCLPALYETALAYAINPLTGQPSPAGRWRVRNWLTWTRPNPPVGALGDKVRPATSYVTVGCTSDRRWFDLDAVRGPGSDNTHARLAKGIDSRPNDCKTSPDGNRDTLAIIEGDGGAPPLDWWDWEMIHGHNYGYDRSQYPDDTVDNSWQPLHRLPTAPYKGAHYATFPIALPERLIKAMCPLEVCTVCGEPRRRIVDIASHGEWRRPELVHTKANHGGPGTHGDRTRQAETLGWTDCGCEDIERSATPEEVDNGCELGISYDSRYRPGRVLDPFAGSGTTLVAAALNGRDATGIDIDHRNVALCRQRLTETMLIVNEVVDGNTWTWTVNPHMPGVKDEHPDQQSLFEETT